MITFLSPAKTLDFEGTSAKTEATLPYFLDEAEKVNHKLRKLSRNKLMDLQSISRQLAELNHHRNQIWTKDHSQGAKQAALAFKGDVYQGLQVEKWSAEDMEFATRHLRILSGLYGILKPSDLILPYRLEMGTSLPVGRRKDLYHFWADKVKAYFKQNIDPEELLLNLASNEYFKLIETAKVRNPVLSVEFRDFSKGDFKIISFFAKKARGLMADFVVSNRIDKPEDLKAFDTEGYYFDVKASTRSKFVFLRDQRTSP